MARIAGVVSDRAEATEAARGPVLAALATHPGEPQVRTVGCAVLGVASGARAALVSRGPLTVAFDGAIYNARELGGEIALSAALFAELVEQFGIDEALTRINGDFALAVYDASTSRLSLARDRMGVKPLYYAARDRSFAFASMPTALLALPGVDRSVNRTYAALFAGSHYRTFDNDPHASPFRGIAQLPAAHLLEVTGAQPRSPRRYWTLAEAGDHDDADVGTLADQYRGLLLDAVRLRVEAARSPAFTLSGGMDSSSVLASAAHATGHTLDSYSSVYQDPTYDESAEIQSMLQTGITAWHPISIDTPDVFGVVERMVRAHGEPVATATWLSHFLLAEQVSRDGHGAIFGGLGGDELNAGEYEYFFFHFADLKRAGREDLLQAEIIKWAEYHDHPIYRKDAAVASAGIARLVDLAVPGRNLPDRTRIERYAAALSPEFFDLRSFEPVMDRPFQSYLKNRTYQDLFRETAPCCLRAEDRHSATFGLEHFDPFFDYRLVEFMFRVPGHLKIREGVTKILLREATRGLLPEETRTRIKKTGWNAPAHRWFVGDAANILRDMVASRRFRERGIYDAVVVQRLIDEHESIVSERRPVENHMMFLWQLVNLESWLQMLQSEPAPA